MPSNPRRWLSLALVLSFTACKDLTTPDSSEPTPPPGEDAAPPDVRPAGPGPVSDRFVPIDPARLILVDDPDARAQGVYRFRVRQQPDRIAGPGDFVHVGDAQGGLRRVVDASRAGEEIVLTTMQAFWHEVIVGGTYTFSMPLPSWRPGVGPDGSPVDPSAPLPELGQTVDSVDLCPVVDSLLGVSLICTRKERTRIDRGVVELNGRIEKVFLVKGSATITGDMDGTYTIDPGGSIIPGSGRAPVFSPCNELPHLVGCFSKAGDALRSFLIWVGINPNVLTPFRMCIPGTVLVVDPGSFFPFRAPVLRVCRITDYGALPDFTPPGLRSAVVVLRPRLSAELVMDVVASGTLKLTIPMPGMAVVKCVGFRIGFFCLKAGAVVPLQLHVVDVGGQLQLKGETLETVNMAWTPETEWVHQWENKERSFQANVIPNNPADTISFRFGSGFVLGAEICFGAVSESGCVDQGDGTTGEGGLLDLKIGVKAKAQVSHNMEGVWSRDPTFDNWHIDIDGFDELELEGALILPRLLLRLDKNLKRSWTVQCCRMETEDLHGTGELEVQTKTTGNVGDPDGYQVTIYRADTLPTVSDPGTTRLSPPAWGDTLSQAIGINSSHRFLPSAFCGVLYSDQAFVSFPILVFPPGLGVPMIVPFGMLVPAARRLGIGIPNFSWEAACGLVVADYVVTLSGVADHCRVVGLPSKTVRLQQARAIPARERLATVMFEIACHDPAAMPGSLEVSVTTTGRDLDLDPDGYAIQLDGMTQLTIPANGSGSLTGLDPGLGRQLRLTGLAPNCQARTGDERTVDITPGGTAAAHFDVACTPKVISQTATSSLRVTTITTGASPDPDGYTLQLNGVAGGSIGANAEVLLSERRAGRTDVVLGGVATNCAVSGGTWVKLDLPVGGVAALTYMVSCEAAADAPTTGSVRVRVATSGADPDPDGYLLDVGGITGPIDINADRTVDGLAPGTALVRLDGMAPNCGVQPDVPLSVPVSVDVTSEANLTIQCQAYGRLEVSTTRTGSATDPDGYRLVVDGIDRGPLGTSETRIFGQIVAGDHAVQLDGLASNCRIDGIEGKPGHRKRNAEEPALPNPVVVSMAPGESVPVQFVVACVPPEDLGALRIGVKEQGQGAGSYQAFVDGTSRGTVTAGAELLVTGLFPESHRVHLEVIPVECKVNGQHPRSVNLPRGQTHPVEFTLVCGKGKP